MFINIYLTLLPSSLLFSFWWHEESSVNRPLVADSSVGQKLCLSSMLADMTWTKQKVKTQVNQLVKKFISVILGHVCL